MTLVHGIPMRLERDKVALFERKHGAFEPETVAAYTQAIENDPEGCVIDVGAYTGLFTLLALKAGAKEVISLEPNPSGHARLLANLEANHADSRARVLNVAAGSYDGTATLHVDQEERGICSTGRIRPQACDEPTRIEHHVDMIRIDALDPEHRVSVIKMDVEGHEVQALHGAQATLEAYHPVLFIEVNSRNGGDRVDPITTFLSRFGYNGEPIDDRNMVFR